MSVIAWRPRTLGRFRKELQLLVGYGRAQASLGHMGEYRDLRMYSFQLQLRFQRQAPKRQLDGMAD